MVVSNVWAVQDEGLHKEHELRQHTARAEAALD